MRVTEVNMERRNEGTGETGDPREILSTNGIVWHDSHLRKSTSWLALVGDERANCSATVAPLYFEKEQPNAIFYRYDHSSPYIKIAVYQGKDRPKKVWCCGRCISYFGYEEEICGVYAQPKQSQKSIMGNMPNCRRLHENTLFQNHITSDKDQEHQQTTTDEVGNTDDQRERRGKGLEYTSSLAGYQRETGEVFASTTDERPRGDNLFSPATARGVPLGLQYYFTSRAKHTCPSAGAMRSSPNSPVDRSFRAHYRSRCTDCRTEDIHRDSSPFILQPFHELSNGFWPCLTSTHPAIQFVPKMFYRVEVGVLGGPV
ncbi:hypothetical protein PR048_012659 [Dryococelus australis]|uniref:Uncharacterized protein n=1 Tax=Dryococelus australis TaxID=614101 RepID=A0ABQ9HRF4_9NEOP|nr:hypothetical protein PR048_012659 [Dryococelus australis]